MRKPRLGTVLISLWGILLTAFVCAYLAWLQPSRLSGTVSRVMESTLNVHCDMGRISLELFPLPTVTIDDLSVHRGSVDHLEFHARQASFQVSWFSLLRLKPIVRTISLDSPTLDICGAFIQKPISETSSIPVPVASFTVPDIPRYVTGLRVSIRNGALRFASSDGKGSFSLSGIDVRGRVPSIVPGRLDLSVAAMRCLLSSGLDISAQDTHISVSSLSKDLNGEWEGRAQVRTALQLGSLDSVMGRRISDPFRYFPMPEPLRISIEGAFRSTPEQGLYAADGQTSVTAVLPMNGHNVPISLSTPFSMTSLESGIEVSGADARMGDDRLVISGRISGLTAGRPMLKGKAELCHFSLTRWFGFGRLMDPGLQKTLDNITGAFHEFELTPYGVVVPKLTAIVEDIELHGSGSCTEFLKPVVRIDAHAKTADLNRVFTELHGVIPDLSYLPPPVLPMDKARKNTPPAPDAITVGYDIHISADDAKIMNFRVQGADVHVIPAPGYGTMLTVDVGGLYGGKADAKVYLQDKVRIVADLQGVLLAGPTEALAGYPAFSGGLKKGHVDISFKGGNGIEMLTTLGGTIDADMYDGAFLVKGSAPLKYKDFTVKAKAEASSGRGSKTMPPSVDFTGSWNVALNAETWAAHADTAKATLAFSTKYGLPCIIRDQSIPLTLTLKKTLCPQFTKDIVLDIKGRSGFNAEKGTLSLKGGIVENPDFSLKGDADFKDVFKAPAVSGKAAFSTADLKKAAHAFGVNLPVPDGGTSFGKANAEAVYAVDARGLKLEKLKGSLDDSTFSGHLVSDWLARPRIDGAFTTPFVDLDFYLPKTEGPRDPNAPKTPLPLAFLKDCDVNLDLTAGRLRVFSTPFSRVELPVTQKDGRLDIPISTAFSGGGSATGHFSAALSEDASYANIALQARASQVDMLALSRSRGQKTLISGLGNGDVSLLSAQRNWDDWRRRLDGFFSFFISNGAIISPSAIQPEANAQPAQSRTNFNAMSMSGVVHNGIVSCKDLRLQGNMINVTGGGTVDLDKETIDAKATVTVAGIPEMPIVLTGSLFAPETNYQLLGAVTGTIGNIGSSLIDLVGSVISAPFKILTGKRILQ